jgi:hypothetical protein
MATKTKAKRLHTPKGIMCYVNVFKPKPARVDAKTGQPTGEPKFQVVMYWPKKTDLSELEEAIEQAAIEKFGAKAPAMLASGKLANPLRDAEEFEDNGAPFDKPGYVMSFKSTDRPGVVDEDSEPIMDKSDCYSGCEGRVSANIRAYDNVSKGVTGYLVNVQKLGDGERLSGNPSAEDDFANAPAKSKGKKKSEPDMDETVVQFKKLMKLDLASAKKVLKKLGVDKISEVDEDDLSEANELISDAIEAAEE